MKNWPKPTSIKDIYMFIGFANFYQSFIQGFSKIAALLTSMLKTTKSFEELAPKAFKANNNKVVEGDGKAEKTVVNSSKFKNEKSRKLMCMPNIKATKKPNFLISDAKKAFIYLWLAFIKAPIFQHFNLKSYIRIQIDVLGYAIGRVLS